MKIRLFVLVALIHISHVSLFASGVIEYRTDKSLEERYPIVLEGFIENILEGREEWVEHKGESLLKAKHYEALFRVKRRVKSGDLPSDVIMLRYRVYDPNEGSRGWRRYAHIKTNQYCRIYAKEIQTDNNLNQNFIVIRGGDEIRIGTVEERIAKAAQAEKARLEFVQKRKSEELKKLADQRPDIDVPRKLEVEVASRSVDNTSAVENSTQEQPRKGKHSFFWIFGVILLASSSYFIVKGAFDRT